MTIIVAADEKWGIGKNNELLVRIPADLKNFKTLTTGNVVVLGRKTLETFPGKKPLPNRVNIIMSRDSGYATEGAEVCHSTSELLEMVKAYEGKEIFVIGGGMIYEELLPYCDKAIVTRIDKVFDADTYFPDLDGDEAWEITDTSEEQTLFDLTYHYVTYKRI